MNCQPFNPCCLEVFDHVVTSSISTLRSRRKLSSTTTIWRILGVLSCRRTLRTRPEDLPQALEGRARRGTSAVATEEVATLESKSFAKPFQTWRLIHNSFGTQCFNRSSFHETWLKSMIRLNAHISLALLEIVLGLVLRVHAIFIGNLHNHRK